MVAIPLNRVGVSMAKRKVISLFYQNVAIPLNRVGVSIELILKKAKEFEESQSP